MNARRPSTSEIAAISGRASTSEPILQLEGWQYPPCL